jgi:hypothetical protein
LQQKGNRHFVLLKQKVAETLRSTYPGMSPDIAQWKGQDIVNFQEELLQKVNAHISEKWFYTHMKSGGDRLPRIDMLNLLSKYAGYADWNDFTYQADAGKGLSFKSGNRYFVVVPLLVVAIMVLFWFLFKLMSTREYQFCFYDAVTKEPIEHGTIEVSLLKENESPVRYLCDDGGCFILKTDQVFVEMVVRAPYYHADTIRRILRKFNRDERVGLQANEYAMMLRFFSEGRAADWKKRRAQLDAMFDEAAMIYQVHDDPDGRGMQLYTKWEFIDWMSMPAQSLQHIDILDAKTIGERIMVLRFRVKRKEQ